MQPGIHLGTDTGNEHREAASLAQLGGDDRPGFEIEFPEPQPLPLDTSLDDPETQPGSADLQGPGRQPVHDLLYVRARFGCSVAQRRPQLRGEIVRSRTERGNSRAAIHSFRSINPLF